MQPRPGQTPSIALPAPHDPMTPDGIASWLRRHAMPCSCDLNSDFYDLEHLTQLLESTTVLGLAECTHGTREFFHLRHRLLRFLITRMGFNALAIEASRSAAQAVNDYVLLGKGDRDGVLTGLGFVMWDVEEFAQVLDWLRDYNRSVAEDRQVSFYGIDIWNTRVARERLLGYVMRAAPECAVAIGLVLETIASSEARGMMLAHEQVSKSDYLLLQALASHLTAHRDPLVRRTSAVDYQQALEDVQDLQQWLRASLTDELEDEWPASLPTMGTLNNYARSKFMADNVLQLLQAKPRTKLAIWAHVFHLGIGFEHAGFGTVPTLGQYLRQHLGERYYVFGLELNDGSYLARTWLSDDTLGNFVVGHIPTARTESVPGQLSGAGLDCLLLDFRGHLADPQLQLWGSAPRALHAISWVHRDPPPLYADRVPILAYDGIIYIAHTTATTPTRNALKVVAARSAY